MSIIDDILGCTDDILGLRDCLGANKNGPIYILTRTWDGEKGRGDPCDTIEQVLPSPMLVNFSHSLRLREGGTIKQGDILLKHISKQSYPQESMLDCTVEDEKTMERFYYFDNHIYECITVTQDYVYWNVQVRKTKKLKLYIK